MSENKGEREQLRKNKNINNNEEIGFLTAKYISRERYERRKAREREREKLQEPAQSYPFQLVSLYSDSQMFWSRISQSPSQKNVWLTRP